MEYKKRSVGKDSVNKNFIEKETIEKKINEKEITEKIEKETIEKKIIEKEIMEEESSEKNISEKEIIKKESNEKELLKKESFIYAKEFIDNVKTKKPIIHNITNYVSVNDCANIILACGASPIMADDVLEVEEITAICNALVINIGTLNVRTVEAMVKAGRKANELGHPVILDPVGAGASTFRTETTKRLLDEVKFQVIRGNISEIKTVYMGSNSTKGVDADVADKVTDNNLEDTIGFAKVLSKATGAVIAITGAIDIVTDSNKAYVIRNGHPLMGSITGTGCMLTAVIGAFCAANPQNMLEAAALSVCAMGICGETAYAKMKEKEGGTSSMKMYLIDYMSKLEENIIMDKAKCDYKILS